MIFAKKIGNLTSETEIHVEVISWLHNCCRMPRFKWRKDMFVRAVCQSYASYVYQLTCTATLIWANFFFAFVKFLFELLHFYLLIFERLENEKCIFFCRSFTALLSPFFDSATIPRTLTQIPRSSRSGVGRWAPGQFRNWSKNPFLNLGNPLLNLGGGSFS